MGLFKPSEQEIQREKERQERIAEREKERQNRELQALVERYHLTDMNESDLLLLQKITYSMAGNNLMHFGELLKGQGDAKTGFLSAIVEQNFMMIKQLSEMNSKLSKILENKNQED